MCQLCTIFMVCIFFCSLSVLNADILMNRNKNICHTAIENLSDPIGYLLDFTHP
jgi:hypothetical protein